MSDWMWLAVLIVLSVLALAFGVWVGLGYPGVYEKYEKTGKAPRGSPFQLLLDWVFDRIVRKR